jgi:hypothetical protein
MTIKTPQSKPDKNLTSQFEGAHFRRDIAAKAF